MEELQRNLLILSIHANSKIKLILKNTPSLGLSFVLNVHVPQHNDACN
jgi:hypothetical protein